ncbi:MAG: DUF1513 domain-containing protein [Pseudomonadota bacterium]
MTATEPQTAIASAWSDHDGSAHAGVVTSRGDALVDVNLPGRGHGICLAPDNKTAVVFARRPGRFATVIDLVDQKAIAQIDSLPDRHFYGHGAFSADGTRLFASENDFENSAGRIGIYDATDGFRRIGEWSSHGLEPHEIVLMPGGKKLAVANGGIRTHPESGRKKLNLDTMVSSVVLMDSQDGALLASVSPPDALHRLSLRHMAVNDAGRLAIAIQYQGAPGDLVPLLATWDGHGPLAFIDDGEPVVPAMKSYCGSVVIDRGGTVIALTSAPGYLVTFWRIDDLSLIAHRQIPDVCGAAPLGTPGRFLLSSGTGAMMVYDVATDDLITCAAPKRMWDNHLTAV